MHNNDGNNSNPDLGILDEQILNEMIEESEDIQEDTSSKVLPIHDSLLTTLNAKVEKTDKETSYILNTEDLTSFCEKIAETEEQVFQELLRILSITIGFSGGTQKFLDTAINQLRLGDIQLKKEKLDSVIEGMVEIKVLVFFLKLQQPHKEQEFTDLEATLCSKLLTTVFGLGKESPSTAETSLLPLITSTNTLNKNLTPILQDLRDIITRSTKANSDQQHTLVKKLDALAKQGKHGK